MKEKWIEKKKLASLIEAIGEKYRVFAPLERGGNVGFAEVGKGDDVRLQGSNSKVPPKSLFFPQVEKLLSLEEGRWREEPLPDEKRVVFGLRPCDCKSLSLLDKVFLGMDIEDPYYLQKRKNTVVVALACNTPQSTCFCTSFGGGPFSEEGADLMLRELEEGYLLNPINGKGEELIQAVSDLLSDPRQSDSAEREKLEKSAVERIHPKLTLEKLGEKLSGNFEDPLWDELYEKCLGCGACTYLCPTCHCFDITDQCGERIRSWDTCQFPLFTRHASGHNPRTSGRERVRQRIMHKFSYCPENFGETFCVGCGRCVRFCPVNLDIRSAVDQLSEKLEQ
ncbi:MAG: 4Fe-4S dicluster domain-containing protein [Candidatus Latescibacterota bacterium]